jgi:succinate dehydrogenase / fumarate reductase iron-sulfur subunit
MPVVRPDRRHMTQFFKQYNSIKPHLINDNAAGERLQSPEERDELNGFVNAFLCASRSTSRPSQELL